MNPALATALAGLAGVILNEWSRYLERKQLPAGWKPGPQDISDFLAEIDAASPEAVKAQARKDLSLN